VPWLKMCLKKCLNHFKTFWIKEKFSQLWTDFWLLFSKETEASYWRRGDLKEIGLEVNADKTKCMVMSRDRNAGRGHSVKIDNSSIESVEEFRYLGVQISGNDVNRSKFYSGRN
jgi:hypothetical protein